MTEILDLATSIADTKENIRTTIVARGIACGKDIKFADYPGKISQIARDPAVWARNDLDDKTPVEGTRVLLKPLEQSAGLQVKFSNALQKQNWGGLCLYPYTTTRLMCDTAKNYGGCGMYSWTEEDGLSEIFTTTTGTEDYGSNMYVQGLKFLSNNLATRYDCNAYTSADYQYFWTPDSVVTSNQYQYIYNDGYGVKSANSSNWTLWKVSDTGEFTEQVGQDVTGISLGRYYNLVYVSPDGQYVIDVDNCYLWKNEGGALTRILTSLPDLKTIVESKSYYNILGGTSDGKYMIVNRYSNTADGNGVRNFPAIIEISNDYQTYTEYTDLAITGLPTWYPWLQTLCVKNAQGVVRMFKYADGKWKEISIDFPDTFTSGCDNRVTLNYDGTQICVTDATAYNNGNVYLYNLAVTANGYKAMTYSKHNFDNTCLTGYATGQVNASSGTVEANALLPSLDNMTYTPPTVVPPPSQSVEDGVVTE